jgi:hypothetical protein
VVEGLNKKSGRVVVEHVAWGSMGDDGELRKKLTHVLPNDIRWAEAKSCDDVVFQKEVDPQGHFNVETERARLARDPLTKEDWQSIEKKNTWVKSGVVDRMVSYFNMMGNRTVLVTNIALEHALFPNAKEVTDLKAFLERNDPAKIGAVWQQRWTRELECLLMPLNIGNEHWCLLVVNLRNGSVELWDSMKSPGSDWYDQIDRERLQAFMRAFNPELSDLHISIARVPQQKGKTNCGVFMLEFIRAFLNGERDGSKVDVSEARVLEYRAQIVSDLKIKKI